MVNTSLKKTINHMPGRIRCSRRRTNTALLVFAKVYYDWYDLKMQNPCHYCVAPKRYPGCHDHCQERQQYVETELTQQHQYKEKCRMINDFNNELYTYNLRYREKHQHRY